MTIHEEISVAMQRWIDERGECVVISPTALAVATLHWFESAKLEPHIEYTSLEHFKQLARRVLAGRFDHESDENPVYESQGELFSGRLQDRYPVPRSRKSEPQYKLRSLLDDRERAWNVNSLRKTAMSRLAHADALEAEGRGGGGEMGVA